MDYIKNSVSTRNYYARRAPSLLMLGPPALAADRFHKLAGPQIAATLGGMQFTDEEYWHGVFLETRNNATPAVAGETP